MCSITDSYLVPSAAPGAALETFVGEGVTSMVLVNVLSGTEYNVKVIASYSTGPSEALSGRAKTRESTVFSVPGGTNVPQAAEHSDDFFSSPWSVFGGDQPDTVPGEGDESVRPVAASPPRQHLQAADRVSAE